MTETAATPRQGEEASPLLDLPGAVADPDAVGRIAWHYGNPTREQRALLAGEAVADLSDRGVIAVTGADRLTWLDTLSTQRLRDLTCGQSQEALVLSPHGHVENALHVVDDGTTTWLSVEPGQQDALLAHLQKMRFMLRVEPVDATARWASVGFVPGGAAEEVVSQRCDLTWRDPWPATGPGGVAYNPVSDAEHPGTARPWVEALVARESLASLAHEAPALAGSWAAEALRVAALRPRFGYESDHRTIPHEVDWLRTAVHLQKGCYRGQETVARVHNLGRPPRRLVLLHLDGSGHGLVERGAAVLHAERTIGRITTAALHFEDGPIALAVVKRSVPITDTLLVDGVAAAQAAIVAN